jgi:hypothetical protein
MFSKASDEWSTPQDFWALLDFEFGFDVDAAASSANHKTGKWFGLDTSLSEGRARDGVVSHTVGRSG